MVISTEKMKQQLMLLKFGIYTVYTGKFGHGTPNISIPIGAKATVDTDKLEVKFDFI